MFKSFSGFRSLIAFVVYRTRYASLAFFEEFENLVNILANYNENVFILGDFNFHLESSEDTDAQKFFQVLSSHGFEARVNKPTHRQGGWLDVVASRTSLNIYYIETGISGHKLLT